MNRPSTIPQPKHLRETSFGEFHSAPSTPSQRSSSPELHDKNGHQPQLQASGAGHELGEHDLLGSFEDLQHAHALNAGLSSSQTQSATEAGPSKQRQPELRDAHHNHSAVLINLLTDEESGEVRPLPGDPHLELYSGPDATLLLGPDGGISGGPSMIGTPTSSYHTAATSSPPHPFPLGSRNQPPRRLSTIDIMPRSPPALSSEAGDSFIYRALAPKHDQHGHPEDAEEGMRRLSVSPTKALSHFLPRPGRVGTFPKRTEKGFERTNSLDKKEESDDGEGGHGDHERAATSPSTLEATGSDPLNHEEDESFSRILGKSWTKKGHKAATLGGKAAQEIKSKWKTVIGPGTFSPPNSRDLFGTQSGLASFGFSQKELDAPSALAMPVETSHHTPFLRKTTDLFGHFGASPSGSGSGVGGGSYIPPSGAPGFKGDKWVVRHEEDEEKTEWSGTRLLGRRERTVGILDEWAADALRPNLPPRQRLTSKWTLLFSIDQHGASLSTFYRLIEDHSHIHPEAGNLLIIKDSNNRRFGVFMNEWIRKAEGTYTGSGDSWLFKLIGEDINVRAEIFRWTGKNHYFALCQSGFISFGGGDGKYGLYLDAAFMHGSSARCPAYDNEVLCAKEGSELAKGRFECMGMEVWATG